MAPRLVSRRGAFHAQGRIIVPAVFLFDYIKPSNLALREPARSPSGLAVRNASMGPAFGFLREAPNPLRSPGPSRWFCPFKRAGAPDVILVLPAQSRVDGPQPAHPFTRCCQPSE